MARFSELSIRQRIWLVLSLAIAPLFILTVSDYFVEREQRLARFANDARLMLNGVLIAEIEQRNHVEALLRTFAGANEMGTADARECNALAARLMAAHRNLANLGAVTPDGLTFCSGTRSANPVNVSDRLWFQQALAQPGVSTGQFLIRRISGQPSVTFGLRVEDGAGKPSLLVFAATQNEWFDRFTGINSLPDGWTSLLLTADGQALSRFPEPENWRGKSLNEASREQFRQALARGERSVRMIGLDGVDRLFVLQPLDIAAGQLVASVGIPVAQTLAVVEREFWFRLLLIAGVTLLALLIARALLGELVERRFADTLVELRNLRRALDDVPAYVYIKDAQGHYRYANQKTLELFGVDAEQIAGRGDEVYFTPNAVEKLHAIDQQVIASGRSKEMVTEIPGRAGSRTYLDVKTPIFDEISGRPQGLIGISTDITEQQRSLEAIRKLSRAVEQSPESIVFTNLDAEIEYVNAAFLRATGYTREEVIGQNPRILQSGKTPRERHLQMWEALNRGETWHGEFINKRKDGSEYIESVFVSPVRDDAGQTTHYVAVKQDITEQRQNELALDEYRSGLEKLVNQRTYELAVAKEAAEAANRAKSSFLANMSHEIRTPLNAIIGLNHLMRNGALPPAQKARSEKVDQAAHHLLQVINDILDLSRIEAGRVEIESQPFSPADLIEDVALMIRERAIAKGLELVVTTANLPPMLEGDAMRLRQVLLNFAGNAVKFTEHGKIEIRGEVLSDDTEACLCSFAVKDTGIGIRQDQIPRLFRPFEQLDGSTTRQFGGTGLGLAIANHLAILMHGDIGVESQPGAGSTFWLTALLAHARDNNLRQTVDVPTGRLRGRVLLVEDEMISREVGIDLLAAIGIEVVAVDNGQLAVDAVKQQQFDLILMDIQMPVMDGLAATYAIRQLPGASSIPIVAMTANAFASDRERCLAAGMNDFLAKPVSAPAFYALLGRYLAEAAPAEADAHSQPAALSGDQLANALGQMIEMMRVGNIDARSVFSDLSPSLAAIDPAGSKTLASLLASYDFDGALPVAESILNKLTSNSSESLALGGSRRDTST